MINAYRIVRDDVEDLIAELRHHVYESDHYYAVRAQRPASLSQVQRAARFICLLKTGFNGLWRVNRHGHFNVPFGRHVNPLICDADLLRACSLALKDVRIECQKFERVLDEAVDGDFAYFDPPYAPLNATSLFTAYTSDGFGHNDQRRLRDVALELARRGVHVIISNSTAPAIHELYRDESAFEIFRVSATRNVSAKVSGRAAVEELIIRVCSRGESNE